MSAYLNVAISAARRSNATATNRLHNNEAVAAVNRNGRVSFKAVGTATVTADLETGLKAVCEVTVSKPESLTENKPL